MFSYDDIGSGPVLLMLHGLGNQKEAWKPQHDLSNHFRLIIPDMIGHGNSPINENINLDHAIAHIMSLMNYLDIDKFFVCGHSLGGVQAQELTRQHPERVLGLVLANTCSYIPFFSATFMISKQEHFLRNREVVDFKKDAIKHCLYTQDEKVTQLANDSFFINEDTYIPSSKMAVGRNYFPFLPQINVPVLIICSTKDKVTPFFQSYMMHRFIKNSKLVIIDETGHLTNLEKPERFNTEVFRFMEDIS